MCKFMSCISNGKGKVLYFKVKEIAKLMAEGNPKNYNPNSHTSIADFNGIKGAEEDRWNKWEYNINTKELKYDSINFALVNDDSKQVKEEIEKYLSNKNKDFLINLYGLNTGYMNTGYMNTGDRNTGDRNTGYMNTGYRNTGDRNTGYMNTGDRNTGDMNTGYRNTGDRNTGDFNKCDFSSGFFNTKTEDTIKVFNKNCKRTVWEKAKKPQFINFELTKWVYFGEMTDEEKAKDLLAEMRDGYLKTIPVVKAWEQAYKKATPEDIKLLKKLPNFNKKVFFEITGIKIK